MVTCLTQKILAGYEGNLNEMSSMGIRLTPVATLLAIKGHHFEPLHNIMNPESA